jgi:hypothetical protein
MDRMEPIGAALTTAVPAVPQMKSGVRPHDEVGDRSQPCLLFLKLKLFHLPLQRTEPHSL